MEDNRAKKSHARCVKKVDDPLKGSVDQCEKREEGARGESFPLDSVAVVDRTEYAGCSSAAGGELVTGANARDSFEGETVRVACGCGSYSLADGNDNPRLTEMRIGERKRASTTSVTFLRRMSPIFVLACLLTLHHGRPAYASVTAATTTSEPEFLDEIENITVPAGRNVKFSCSVKDLGVYKVAWMLFDKSAILTVQNHVITRNPRISVSHDKHRTWYLHISDVHEDDKGKYMCQINTASAKTQYGYLHVVVPPNIDDSQTSSDVIVRENYNMSLTCKATGSPTPSIRWKRDDGSKIVISKNHSVQEWEGETLEMWQISRLSMGAYLCIASNGVPPSVSKQIKVSVDFAPGLEIPHQLVGAPLGYMINLECFTEAHPTSLNYWTREDNMMIHESAKYRATSVPMKPSYKTHMTLTIFNVQNEDYGMYKCVAKNPRGCTDGTIHLYKSPPPSTSPSPTTPELIRKDWDPMTELNNSVYGNPSSLTIHNEKKVKSGNKFQSNLNEIGKSEQKSTELDRKRNYNWRPDNGGRIHVDCSQQPHRSSRGRRLQAAPVMKGLTVRGTNFNIYAVDYLATNITTTGMLLAMCLIVSTVIR